MHRRNVDDMHDTRLSSSHRCQRQIMVKNRDFCLPHLHSLPPLRRFHSEYCHDVWCGKTIEWCGYPMVKKLKISLFVLTEYTYTWQTGGHTESQTPHDGVGHACACIASRGKNVCSVCYFPSLPRSRSPLRAGLCAVRSRHQRPKRRNSCVALQEMRKLALTRNPDPIRPTRRAISDDNFINDQTTYAWSYSQAIRGLFIVRSWSRD